MNKKSGKPTIYDIAKIAGISPSTVSRTLRNDGYPVSSETKEKVLAAVHELDYDTSIYELNEKEPDVGIAVILPNIINPYYSSLVTGVEYKIQSNGMEMTLFNTGGEPNREVKIVENLISSRFVGVIIVSICDNHDHIKKLINSNIKVVACEQSVDLDCNSVTFNYFEGGLLATEYLINKGKKNIAFISSPLNRKSRIGLYQGYKKALKRSSITLDKKLIRVAKDEKTQGNEIYEFRNGQDQIDELLKEKIIPDAIFCINDITAIGVIHQLQYHGFRIPDDIGVIGFDNIFFSSMIYPSLTTIDQCTYELGSLAAEILMGNINDPNRGNISTVLEPKLIIRDSV